MPLGPSVVRYIVIRQLAGYLLLLIATMAAAVYLRNWAWLGVGGTVITAGGALQMSSRLLRLGPAGADGDLPPTTLKGGEFNMGYIGERIQREADNWTAWVGLWVTWAGAIVAGALPFVLDSFFPFTPA